MITTMFKKDNVAGPDGKMYRSGQRIFSVSRYGSIVQSLTFL